ncbi:MAG: hypothetical protein K0B08_09470, partial [Bacteroidales bacterium]|nr:hypothetical protein [Bacteroidales bacterium]
GVNPKDAPAFDMIRASVNLVVASTLIALGTSLKLPLSTTYVTFMVAMATSLSDRAWGKDSAVYRVTGVFVVIAGWFLTALTAFVIAGVFASVLKVTGPIGTIILVGLAVFSVIRTQVLFRRREKRKFAEISLGALEEKITPDNLVSHCSVKVNSILVIIPDYLQKTYEALMQYSLRDLKKINQQIAELNDDIRHEKISFPQKIQKFPEDFIDTGSYYIQVLDYLKEVGNCMTFIVKPSLDHVDNNHQELTPAQHEELAQLSKDIAEYYSEIIVRLKGDGVNDSEKIRQMEHILVELIGKFKKRQIKRIKTGESKTRNSMLYLAILEETKKLVIYTHSVIKALDELLRSRP